MNIYNLVDLICVVVFSMSPKFGVLGHKAQDLVILFFLGKVESLPQFHFRYLQSKSDIYLLNDKTRQTNNLTGKYIMEALNFKYLQCHIAPFKLEYRPFEYKP